MHRTRGLPAPRHSLVLFFSRLRLGIASEASHPVSAADYGFDWLIAPLSALNEVETFEQLLS